MQKPLGFKCRYQDIFTRTSYWLKNSDEAANYPATYDNLSTFCDMHFLVCGEEAIDMVTAYVLLMKCCYMCIYYTSNTMCQQFSSARGGQTLFVDISHST